MTENCVWIPKQNAANICTKLSYNQFVFVFVIASTILCVFGRCHIHKQLLISLFSLIFTSLFRRQMDEWCSISFHTLHVPVAITSCQLVSCIRPIPLHHHHQQRQKRKNRFRNEIIRDIGHWPLPIAQWIYSLPICNQIHSSLNKQQIYELIQPTGWNGISIFVFFGTAVATDAVVATGSPFFGIFFFGVRSMESQSQPILTSPKIQSTIFQSVAKWKQ